MATNLQGQLEAYISASQLTDVYYLINRVSGAAVARQSVQACLNSLTVLPVDFKVVDAAMRLPMADFEDAVQLAAATANGVTAVVTRDQAGFLGASIPVLAPAALLAQLAAPEEEV